MSRNISGKRPQEAMDEAHAKLKRELSELKGAGLDVDLVIMPLHVWRLEFFRQIGIEDQSDAWKRRLAATLDELASAPGSGKLRLFDFARPHPLVEQSIFAPPPRGERRYYLESSHFYPWLGEKLLETVFAREQDTGAEPTTEPFGRQIGHRAGAISIDEDLATAKAALDDWEAAHRDDVSHVQTLIMR